MQQERVSLMGLPIDALSEQRVIAHILDSLAHRRGGWLITANLDQLRQFRRQPPIRELLSQADLVVADGMPLVWACRLQGTPLPGRVAGSDLVSTLSAAAAESGRSLYLLGDRPAARKMAERTLLRRCPGLRIVGGSSPSFDVNIDADPDAVSALCAELRQKEPDIVYVALGFPKQERLIARLRLEMPTAWFVGVGISLSFLSGNVKRAPRWVSRLGLEWAHRLLQEPRRLARRYLVHGLPFALQLFVFTAVRRLRGARSGTGPR